MQYFGRLRAAHQNHYEQFGRVTGSVEVDGEQSRLEIQVSRGMSAAGRVERGSCHQQGGWRVGALVRIVMLQVMKDHTHGSIRDWRLMHRYCFHQFTTARC